MDTANPLLTLSIIIVSYNTKDITLACLSSVLRALDQDSTLKNATEIIVVDNASTDDSVHACKLFLADEKISYSVMGNIVNLGFAGANNQGILSAKGKYILLLNSDTLVGKNCLTTLIETASAMEPGILSASLWNQDGSYQPQGGDLPGLFSLFIFAFMLDDLPIIGKFFPSIQHTGRRTVVPKDSLAQKGWIAGTAMLLPSTVITKIGLLDEAIFMYAEDIEYCWRAAKEGIHSVIATDAKCIHLGSASSSSAKARIGEFTSLAYVCRKHISSNKAGMCIFLLRTAARIRHILYRIVKNQELSDLYSEISHLPALK